MAQRIILFLSSFKEGTLEQEYYCPGEDSVYGAQTNEAPVRYLLRKYPAVSEVLCIVTPNAMKTAWEQFSRSILDSAPGVQLIQIPFVDGQDFSQGPLSQIMKIVEPGDSILLETTGGFRNAVMHLLLLSRTLSYAGVKTEFAVYSNFQQQEIENVTHLVKMFELVGGMQELTSFGSVKTLRQYYKNSKDERIENLLKASERLVDTITMCRTREIEKRMERFQQALEEAENCSDPLMRALLPAFRQKFGKNMSIPGIIKWCLENDMIQQALTIYKERIPAYILATRNDILAYKGEVRAERDMRDYEDPYEVFFYEQFLKMGGNMRGTYDQYNKKWSAPTVVTLARFEDCLPGSRFRALVSTAKLKDITMDYLYIRTLRNMISHANEQESDSQTQLVEYLVDFNYKRPEDTTMEYVKKMVNTALEHLLPAGKKGAKQ